MIYCLTCSLEFILFSWRVTHKRCRVFQRSLQASYRTLQTLRGQHKKVGCPAVLELTKKCKGLLIHCCFYGPTQRSSTLTCDSLSEWGGAAVLRTTVTDSSPEVQYCTTGQNSRAGRWIFMMSNSPRIRITYLWYLVGVYIICCISHKPLLIHNDCLGHFIRDHTTSFISAVSNENGLCVS